MLLLAAIGLLALAAAPPQVAQATVHDLVAEGVPSATFRFELRDSRGLLVPGRLTFVGDGGPKARLFERTDAAPTELAVRFNVVYTRSGRGAITVPVGPYEVWASRGIEWSAPHATFDLATGDDVVWTPTLEHEVDTAGLVSGDFHLHTLTHSGHGDSNLEERLISLVGEGVEFAVATDHNHNTDYGPTQTKLRLTDSIRTVTGNEVSVPVGHFNVFPLEPDRPVPPTDATDANELFRLIREEVNRYDVVPIIQLNHPRWGNIDYFGQAGLDPITRVSTSPNFSHDFDTLEVFNAGEGWGYYNADTSDRHVGASAHWVLGDWYALLNRGRRPAAVGNSDSHTVHFEFAGYPRNYVPSEAEWPAQIDVGAVAAALREKRVYTTLGPIVDVTVAGEGLGGFARAEAGQVVVELRVQAASWIDCDRVIPVYNGQALEPIAVPDTREVERLWTAFVLDTPRDGWVAFQVEGDDPLAPIVDGGARPVLPNAVTNPIWIDGDGDGSWTSPWEQARAAVLAQESAVVLRREVLAERLAPERALLVLAAVEEGRPWVNELVRAALRDEARAVRLAAARAAEVVGDRSLVDALRAAREPATNDLFADLTYLRATRACGELPADAVTSLLERHRADELRRYRSDLELLAPGRYVEAWTLAGPFPNPDPEAVLEVAYGPEGGDAAPELEWSWVDASVSGSGYVDLRQLANAGGTTDHAIAYARTHLYSPERRTVPFAFGADDGSLVRLEGEPVYQDASRHGANPYQHVGRLDLEEGWNELLVKVENGTGGFGFYLRLFDEEIQAGRPPGAGADAEERD